MIKKIIIAVLSLLTIGFAALTASRLAMDYNENGVYFDGVVTYDTDAIVVYGLITFTLLAATIGLQSVRRKEKFKPSRRHKT